MADGSFPSQAQIVRVIRAAKKAGLDVGGIRVELNGAVVVFASGAPLLASGARPGEDEANDFD